MKDKEIFTLTFGKEFQQNTYSFKPFSAQIKTKHKKEYGIKKIKGFKRVVNIGWSYIIERV